MAVTAQKFTTTLQKVAEERALSIGAGGGDTTTRRVWRIGDKWAIPDVVFANTFTDDLRVHRLRIGIYNVTQNWADFVELTFHNRPICVKGEIFPRSKDDIFASLFATLQGASDKQVTEALLTLKGANGTYTEIIHASDGSYRTEKVFKKD